jgi:hypothetical protein
MKKVLFLLFAVLADHSAQAQTIPFTNVSVPAVHAQLPAQANFVYNCYNPWLPGTEQIATVGNVVTLTLPITADPNTACFDPPPPETGSVTLGPLAAGQYTLVLQPLAPVPPLPNVDYSPVSVPFTVVGGEPMYSNLRIYPNPALANQLITARIAAPDFYSGCFVATLTDVQRVGDVVTMTIRESDLGGCAIGVPPPGPYDFDTPIGRFSEGSYTLRVQYVPDISGGAAFLVLSGNFVVGTAQAIPMLSNTLLALLTLGVALLAAWQWRGSR